MHLILIKKMLFEVISPVSHLQYLLQQGYSTNFAPRPLLQYDMRPGANFAYSVCSLAN